MYAVIKTGGKQYRVATDDVIQVEKLEGDAGGTIELARGPAGRRGRERHASDRRWWRVPGHRHGAGAGQGAQDHRLQEAAPEELSARRNGHRQQLTVLRVTDIKVA